MPDAGLTMSAMYRTESAPQQLLVAAFPEANLDVVVQLLAKTGAEFASRPAAGERPGEPEELLSAVIVPVTSSMAADIDAWLSIHPNISCLCVVQGPVDYIAQALKRGHSLDDATSEWESQAELALELIRQHRFQCLTVHFEQVRSSPDLFGQLLQERFGIELPADIEPEPSDAEYKLFAILAAQHIAEIADLTDLQLELEASAWPLMAGSPPAQSDIATVLAAYRTQMHEQQEAIQALEAIRVEHDKVIPQLHTAQLEIERYARQLEELKNRGDELTQEHKHLSAEAEAAKIKVTELERSAQEKDIQIRDQHKSLIELDRIRAERDQLMDQLHKVQREVEIGFSQSRKLEEGVKIDQESTIRALNEQLAMMRNSTSWRISAPIRTVGRLWKRVLRRR